MSLNYEQKREWAKREEIKRKMVESVRERQEIAKIKAGTQHRESGVTKPGFNFTLGKYIENGSQFKKEWKEYKKTHPDSELKADIG